MSTDLSAFKGNSLVSSDLFAKLMDVNKKLSGGSGGGNRRISIRGGRFHEIVNGEKLRTNSSGSMNIVVLSASGIQRTYYEGTYSPDKTTPPVCWSPDSEKPAAEVPAENRKAAACRDCPMNIKGSGQGNSRACRFSTRLAVAIEGSYDKVYQLSVPATSLFGDAKDGKMPLQAYSRFLSENSMPIISLVTQMYFDEDSETPKLFFKPLRPLEEGELKDVLELADHEDVEKAITLTVYQQDNDSASNAEPKAEPKAEPDEEVEEPTRVAAKADSPSPSSTTLDDALSAWDD